jgi:hypothetical protein
MGQKGLGKTGENYIKTWWLQKAYNRKKEFYNKYVEKGLATEIAGIELYSKWLNEGVLLSKNQEYYSNDFIVGSPDVVHDDIIVDIKCSWDLFTFPYFDTELPNKNYYWQLQGYMFLTGYNKARIAYCLIDTPKPIIQQELKKLFFQSGGRAEDWTPETYQELEAKYFFDDIPWEDKIKIFDVERNDDDISLVKERVRIGRKFLEDCIQSLNSKVPKH